MAKSSFELKLLIDTHSRKVLFAEARKDAVDFLFYILSLPVGTMVRLLQKQALPGSLTNLYQSLECLDDSYIQKNQSKNTFLSPGFDSSSSVPLPCLTNQSANNKFYLCPTASDYCQSHYYTDDPRAICPYCTVKMTRKMAYVAPPPLKGTSVVGVGIVKEVVTYMIMDDLVIKPMSTISSIMLLNNLKVKDMGVLEEKVVILGMEEALKILGCMLNSSNVLTDVYMKGVK